MMAARLDIHRIDFNQHKTLLPKGIKLYRNVRPGTAPLLPSGRMMRFVTEPPDFRPEQYRPGMVEAGTGAFCLAIDAPDTAHLETDELKDKELWEVTLLEDLEACDLDSICRDQGIPQPYMENLSEEDFTAIYGMRIRCLRYPSKKNPGQYNLVVYYDYFPGFERIVALKRLT